MSGTSRFLQPSQQNVSLPVAAAALVGSVSAIKVTEHDKLANLGLENVAKDVAKYGYPRPRTCTLKNAAVRKEW
jgi:tyrosinase